MVMIEKEVFDFYDCWKVIWIFFNIIYFELQEDVFFEIDEYKYYVVSVYWGEDKGVFRQF